MYLKKLNYHETTQINSNTEHWRVDGLTLGHINLIVGKNSSGKTRITNVTTVLARLLAGKMIPQFSSANWDVEFERTKGQSKESQFYAVDIRDKIVMKESFRINKQQIMDRSADGSCFVLRKSNSEKIRYKVPTNQLTAVVRRDEIQHPFFENTYKWANELCSYKFGSDFGKSHVTMIVPPTMAEDQPEMSDQPDNAAHVFRKTMARFNGKYHDLVLSDMEELGYPCEYIGLSIIPGFSFAENPPVCLVVKERDLSTPTTQAEMSQGMYRALALSIHVNANILWTQSRMVGRPLNIGDSPMLIIDDIGEGLDFIRSKKLIGLLIRKSTEHNIQLVMTSNDRFIMNEVPLEHWTVLQRNSGIVKAFNYQNSKSLFDDFKYLGLNNFDFFSGEYFAEK
jgi:hypothetical protein